MKKDTKILLISASVKIIIDLLVFLAIGLLSNLVISYIAEFPVNFKNISICLGLLLVVKYLFNK